MTPFLALLSAYYLCDAAATIQPLPPSVAQSCAARYEAVKAHFRDDGATSPAARIRSYVRFKAWEEANPALVARLKAEARADALALLAGTDGPRGRL
jgi:hypothetical protein